MTSRRHHMSRRRALREALRNAPSWMTSLLLHLTLIVILGSLAVSLGPDRPLAPLLLALGPADEDLEWNVDKALVVTQIEPEVAALSPLEPVVPLLIDHQKVEPPQLSVTPQTETQQPAAAAPEGAAKTQEQEQSVRNRLRDDFLKKLESESRQYDAIVDDFIQYDIGQLTGSRGARARQAFERLDWRALPALVRGLNRSASMSQSCPVMVIANKIDRGLSRRHDPSLIDYALKNIGRDVPDKAKYMSRLSGLKGRLSRLLEGRRAVANSLRSRQLPASDAMVERVMNASNAGNAALINQLESGDRESALATAYAISRFSNVKNRPGKFHIGFSLTRLLSSRDRDLRRVAHSALVTLSEGHQFGPDELVTEEQIVATQSQWHEFWLQDQRLDAGDYKTAISAAGGDREALQRILDQIEVECSSDASGQRRLVLAQLLLPLLDHRDAMVRESVNFVLRRLSKQTRRDLPVLSDVRAERDYWHAFWNRYDIKQIREPRAKAMLAMATALTERGKKSSARKRLREIVKHYPRTESAQRALQYLERLNQ